MLIKCVCSNCGHSYLSDDETADLSCPRCDVANEASRNASDIPAAPMGFEPAFMDGPSDDFGRSGDLGVEGEDLAYEEVPLRFEAKAPPPMFITRERLMRGMIFGVVAAGMAGAALGGAMAAMSIDAPAVSAIVIGLIGGMGCRAGMGGRSAQQTKLRSAIACGFVVVFGFIGFAAGSWSVERMTGSRATQTRADLDEGIAGLAAQHADVQNAGAAIVLHQRMEEARRLLSLSDPQLEDYLWIQQAQINQPLLAHAKLRVTTSPIVKLGPDTDSISVPKETTMGIRFAELIVAFVLASRAVAPRRRRA